jgi:hypothetical protein
MSKYLQRFELKRWVPLVTPDITAQRAAVGQEFRAK